MYLHMSAECVCGRQEHAADNATRLAAAGDKWGGGAHDVYNAAAVVTSSHSKHALGVLRRSRSKCPHSRADPSVVVAGDHANAEASFYARPTITIHIPLDSSPCMQPCLSHLRSFRSLASPPPHTIPPSFHPSSHEIEIEVKIGSFFFLSFFFSFFLCCRR